MRELERSLGLIAVVAVSISAMLGSGIFVLPGLAAAEAGPGIWVAYGVAALCVVPAATSKAELATAMPTSGGTYVYLDRIFGPLVGTVAGLALWLSMLLKSSFALLGFGTYLIVLAELPLRPTALALLAVIVGLNLIGIRAVSRAQVVIVGMALVCLTTLVIAGGFTFDAELMRQPLPHGARGLIAAAGLVFVSYNGVTKIAAIAEEVKNPEKNVPWGIFLSLTLVASVYACVAFVLAGNVDRATLSGDLRPIYTLAERIGGSWAGSVAAVVGVITMVSMANAGLLAASRFPFAMSRDQLLPPSLERISSRFSTPVVAILVTGTGMAVAIVFLDVERLAKLASALVIALYIANNVAVIVFRESGVGWYRPKFRSPLYPWLQGFGIISGLGLLLLLGPVVVLAALLAIVPGAGLFVFYGRRRTRRRGVVLQRGRRSDILTGSGLDEPAAEPLPVDIQETIKGQAHAVVAMFGDERGPETLVEIGTALSGGGKLPVVHLTEVPEQMTLGALDEAPQVQSLRRRLSVMAREEGTDLDFHAVASRDLARTVYNVTAHVHCDFLAMRWRRRASWALMPYNPLGWLIDHLECNLALFRDAGVRYIREILVYAAPGPHDALVVGTADDLARQWGARITLVRPTKPADGSAIRASERDYLKELERLCEAPTRIELLDGPDLVTTLTAATTSYDLLVMGAPKATLFERLVGNPTDRITRKAACSVLTLKTPRARTHEAFARKRRDEPSRLFDFVSGGALEAQLEVTRKEALFEYFGQVFAQRLDASPRAIVDALWDRERTQNTSVGHGVALPHATLPTAKRTVVGVFTSSEAVDYHGPDGKKVDVFFVTISPPSERQTHLQLLSTIARLSLSTDLLDDMRLALTREELLESIRRNDTGSQARIELSAPS